MSQISLFDGDNKLTIDKKVRLIELFAGYGSQSLALKYLGVPFEHHKICEWAIPSIQAYKDIHFTDDNTDYSQGLTTEEVFEHLYKAGVSSNYNEPMTYEQIKRLGDAKARTIYNNIKATHNLVSVVNAKGKDFEITDRDKYCYVMTYSFPCVTADSLVLTENGYKPIVDVKVGEKVLTKSNTWQKVAKKFDNGIHQTCYLNGMGFENIHCTLNHKFLVREMKRTGHKGIRTFFEPKFVEAKDLQKNHYFGIPVIQEEKPFYTDDLDFWYMIGMYLGDGWLACRCNDIVIACNDTKLKKIQAHLDQTKWKYTYSKSGTCYRLRFANKEIYNFIAENIGTGCDKKTIGYDLLCLPKPQLQALYNGYLDSDGCVIDGKHQFSSINRPLIYAMSSVIHKLYQRPTRVYKVKVSPKKIIEGREVNQKDWYMLRFNPIKKKQDHAFFEDDYIWYPFKNLEMAEIENVYNMEVENDHSYILQGCVSKNCQDLSKAGKGMGMAKDSGTRSGMLWQVERILDELNADGGNLPHILLMENVPDVIGTKNISHFADWVKKLDSLGYTSKWQCMNAKNYGVPQNRDRCFMVSWLGDFYYDFPRPFKLTKRLKDVFETNVPKKYYLSSRALDGIKNTPFQSAQLDHRTEKNGVMPTLLARDYKDPKLVEEPFIVASRGRNPENPSDRSAGIHTEQRLEPNSQGICNTLTTVQKDNYVAEPEIITKGYYMPSQHNASRIVDTNGVAPTVMENHGTVTAIEEPQ